MSEPYISKQGETVESICFDRYGYTAQITKTVCDANPGIAALGVVLPTGTEVILPVVKTKQVSKTNNLWD